MTLAEYLASLSHEELYRMRNKAGIDQGMLGPYEHRAFAREFAKESPLRAAMSLPFAIPAYSLSKKLGISDARSPASIEEMKQAYLGLLEGLRR